MLPAGVHEHGGKVGEYAVGGSAINRRKRPVVDEIIAAHQFQDLDKHIHSAELPAVVSGISRAC